MNFTEAVRSGLNQIRFVNNTWLENGEGCLVGAAFHSQGYTEVQYPHRDLERLWPWTADWQAQVVPCCGKHLNSTFAGFCIHLADHLEKQELTRGEVLDILAQAESVRTVSVKQLTAA